MIPASIRTTLFSLSVLFFAALSLPSCITSRKIDKWVDKKISETLPANKKNNDYLAISTTLPIADQKNSTTEKTHSSLLPLIVYWEWHITNTCTLNPKIPYSTFTNTAISYAGSQGIKTKLNGRRIELEVKQMPNAFSIDDVSHMIFIGFYAFGWDDFSVLPQNNNLVVSYKILQENTEVKQGVISIPDASGPVNIKMFQSVKRRTWKYIDQYNENIAAMSKKVVDELITTL
jgi:hypothetical protein